MKYAFVTVLSTNNYYKGVVALFESIKKTNTKYNNFVVIVNEDIFDYIINDLTSRGYIVVKKKKMVFDFIQNNSYKYWLNTFDKFHVFDLEEYDKIVYLDSDMYVAKNIDELFDLPHMSAVRAGYERDNTWVAINSGLMVIEPKEGTSKELINTLKNTNFNKDIGDQDIIEKYYDWQNKDLVISENYNMFSINVDYYIHSFGFKADEMKVIHFSGSSKPWMLNKKEQEDYRNRYRNNNKVVLLDFFDRYLNIINEIGKKLSIITPFYNTLNQTRELASILEPQLTQEIEWIIIDDGTNELELDKLNARVIHLEKNSGNASKPRNIGLDVAKGDYIVFVDSDDLVASDYIESIINKIDEEKFDYCYFGWDNNLDAKYIIEEEPIAWNRSVWNCIYKREIIGNERFNEKLNIDEDGDFNNRVRKGKRANILKILYIYNWRRRKGSLSDLYFAGIIKKQKE